MIISASRRTDIPAFYSEWFFNRLRDGYVFTRNPYNTKQIKRISLLPEDVDCFVFWSKDPASFRNRLSELENFNYYFQFTLTPYEKDLEPWVPYKKELLDTFISLSMMVGKEKIIWRYDPILLNDKYDFSFHLHYFESIARIISPYTEKCVISFIDIYANSAKNLEDLNVREPSRDEMISFAKEFKLIADHCGFRIASCAESIDLDSMGILHNKCIDNILIERIIGRELNYIKDRYQREDCGCVESIDIGAYNTCTHGCLYCYANFNRKSAIDNFDKHRKESPFLIGNLVSKK